MGGHFFLKISVPTYNNRVLRLSRILKHGLIKDDNRLLRFKYSEISILVSAFLFDRLAFPVAESDCSDHLYAVRSHSDIYQ